MLPQVISPGITLKPSNSMLIGMEKKQVEL
jgi:hypothetical protein